MHLQTYLHHGQRDQTNSPNVVSHHWNIFPENNTTNRKNRLTLRKTYSSKVNELRGVCKLSKIRKCTTVKLNDARICLGIVPKGTTALPRPQTEGSKRTISWILLNYIQSWLHRRSHVARYTLTASRRNDSSGFPYTAATEVYVAATRPPCFLASRGINYAAYRSTTPYWLIPTAVQATRLNLGIRGFFNGVLCSCRLLLDAYNLRLILVFYKIVGLCSLDVLIANFISIFLKAQRYYRRRNTRKYLYSNDACLTIRCVNRIASLPVFWRLKAAIVQDRVDKVEPLIFRYTWLHTVGIVYASACRHNLFKIFDSTWTMRNVRHASFYEIIVVILCDFFCLIFSLLFISSYVTVVFQDTFNLVALKILSVLGSLCMLFVACSSFPAKLLVNIPG